ncbi:MAG: peptide deformylase [Candidatus Kerfeldbacteria bacterium]|nr:peptide deformylase [Candidatus Kerfeldbacteria bacterium]
MVANILPLWFLRQPDQARLLRLVAGPVVVSTIHQRSFQQLIDDMAQTMVHARGIGLAAPQIGQSMRLAVIDGGVAQQTEPLVLINPVVKQSTPNQEAMEEGCLSIPGVFGLVPRPTGLSMTALDRRGATISLNAVGLLARVIQHEIDHLNGRLFIDRVTRITAGKIPS